MFAAVVGVLGIGTQVLGLLQNRKAMKEQKKAQQEYARIASATQVQGFSAPSISFLSNPLYLFAGAFALVLILKK